LQFVCGVGVGIVVEANAFSSQGVGHAQEFLHGAKGEVVATSGKINRNAQKAFAGGPVDVRKAAVAYGPASDFGGKATVSIGLNGVVFLVQKGTGGSGVEDSKAHHDGRGTDRGAGLVQTGDGLTVLVNGYALEGDGLGNLCVQCL
jgi:hypothetical protein